MDVIYGDSVLQLSAQRLETLRQVYFAHSARTDSVTNTLAPSTSAAADVSEKCFRQALMSMLLRYQSLDGGGFQCAVPPPVFECLQSLWGVDVEGFASPLNSTLGARKFCSAFSRRRRSIWLNGLVL